MFIPEEDSETTNRSMEWQRRKKKTYDEQQKAEMLGVHDNMYGDTVVEDSPSSYVWWWRNWEDKRSTPKAVSHTSCYRQERKYYFEDLYNITDEVIISSPVVQAWVTRVPVRKRNNERSWKHFERYTASYSTGVEAATGVSTRHVQRERGDKVWNLTTA